MSEPRFSGVFDVCVKRGRRLRMPPALRLVIRRLGSEGLFVMPGGRGELVLASNAYIQRILEILRTPAESADRPLIESVYLVQIRVLDVASNGDCLLSRGVLSQADLGDQLLTLIGRGDHMVLSNRQDSTT